MARKVLGGFILKSWGNCGGTGILAWEALLAPTDSAQPGMAAARRPGRMLLKKILTGAACLLAAACLQAPVALAQHGGGHGGFGGGHVGGGGHYGGGMHTSAPHGSPSASAKGSSKGSSIFHIFHRSTGGAHGAAAAAPAATSSSNPSSFLLRPIPPSHPGPAPTPQPVFFVPVYFGSPFYYGFYGGFNSFGWGCGPFGGAGCFYSPFYGYGYGWGGYGGYSGGWGGGTTGLSTGSNVYSSSSSSSASDLSATPAPGDAAAYHRNDLVELFFKDGTVYDVTDYWLVEGQLHFLTVDESGQKTVEHVVPFDTLDVQTTTDDNASRGFKFQLRNQSMEQYFREHPETVPKSVDPNAPQN